MNRIFIAAMLYLFSFGAHAVDYYWSGSVTFGSYTYSFNGASPVGVCDTFVADKIAKLGGTHKVLTAGFTSATQYACSTQGNPTNLAIRRFGDGCTVGTYDPATGSCVLPAGQAGEECDGPDFFGMPAMYNSAGQCVPWNEADKPALCKSLAKEGTKFFDIYVAYNGDGEPEKPTVEKFGCEVLVVDVAQCKAPVPRCGSGICVEHMVNKCRVGATFTGNTAGDGTGTGYPVSDGAGAEGVCPDGVDCTPAPEPVIDEKKPCNYMYNGQVVSCESSEFKGDPGEMNCGRVNGGPYTCTKKVPKSNGIDIKTKITTEPTADGGTKQTKEDTHTKTTCTAPGSCTTQVTNNTTVVVKDSNGKTVSESGTCTGALCDGSGTGTKPSKGGNCEPGQECGEDEGGSFTGPQNDEVPGFGDAIQSFKAKVEAAPIIAGVKAIQMPSGGSCSMSSASTPIGTISGDTVCQNSSWLDPLYYVFLAMGALNAVRILMSA